MAFCLTIETKNRFKQALKSREIDPIKLAGMDSTARRDFLSRYVGKENAQQVNARFESKLLLKNQKAGYITWAKQVAGISQRAKMDLISRIERMDAVLDPEEGQAFLEDLASTRLGIDVTQQEAKTISDLSEKIQDAKSKANEEGKFKTEQERLNYGFAKVGIEKYINDLKIQSRKTYFREQPLKKVGEIIGSVPATAKSLVASMDNSFWGRQGIKTLLDLRTSKLWFRNFIKSWGDIGRELKGRDAMDLIRADIYSRPNALNGKYKAGDYQLDVLSEEAFPSSLPEKIPVFGRLFKASESAYNGGALRLRADLADRLITLAERNGVNTLNKEEAQGMGHLVGSLTGRGSIGFLTPGGQRTTNVLLFSIKFMKSNFDTLTAHRFDPKATSFTRKEAAKNLLSMVATLAAVTTLAKLLDPESVDEDPRSTNFGKLKIFGKWVDITGGMGQWVTLASRTIVPSQRNGEWGLWMKSSTGKWTNLVAGKFGQQDGFDLIVNGLFANKLSPIAGMFRDALRGEMFGGEKFTLKSALANLITPLSIQNFQDLKKDPEAYNLTGSVILEGLGLSTATYTYKTDWEKSTSKEMTQFKEVVGEDSFKKANEDYNRAYSEWYSQAQQSSDFKRLSDDGKAKLITKAKEEIKQQIFKEYGFKYKAEEKTKQQEQEAEEVEKLLPDKISTNKDSSANKLVGVVNKALDVISKTASASDEKITSVEVKGDNLVINVVDSKGNFKTKYRHVDSDLSIAQEIGKIIANVGKKLGIKEQNVSEKFGYSSVEQRLKEALDYQKALLNQQNKDPFVEKGYIKAGGGYYKKNDSGRYTFIDKDKIPSSVIKSIGEEEKDQKITKVVDKTGTVSPFDKEIEEVFGDVANEAKLVLRFVDKDGNVHGENTGFQTGPEVDIPNNNGTIDRGLWRINSVHFTPSEIKRRKKKLDAAGIKSFEDMYDPVLNSKMAKIIYEGQGWDGWYAAPGDFVSEAGMADRKRKGVKVYYLP